MSFKISKNPVIWEENQGKAFIDVNLLNFYHIGFG